MVLVYYLYILCSSWLCSRSSFIFPLTFPVPRSIHSNYYHQEIATATSQPFLIFFSHVPIIQSTNQQHSPFGPCPFCLQL
ncbi:hypothetical protein BKA57DRAFT_459791 [Linnemannia elongata]|nr:hypothetical protein BKA57DRAFT_459791 [Linnemannia elongata]